MSSSRLPPDSPAAVEDPARRRFFARLVFLASAPILAALGGPVSVFALSPLRRRVPREASLVDLGDTLSFAAVKDGLSGPKEVVVERMLDDGYAARTVKERIALVRDAASAAGLAALSTTCTHLGCGVSWSEEKKQFLCPCHGGVYDGEGRVVSGPPPKPLLRLPLVVEGGRVRLDAGALS